MWNEPKMRIGRVEKIYIELINDLRNRSLDILIRALSNSEPPAHVMCNDGEETREREVFKCNMSDLKKLHEIACGDNTFQFRTWVKRAYRTFAQIWSPSDPDYVQIKAKRALKGTVIMDGNLNPIGKKKLQKRLDGALIKRQERDAK